MGIRNPTCSDLFPSKIFKANLHKKWRLYNNGLLTSPSSPLLRTSLGRSLDSQPYTGGSGVLLPLYPEWLHQPFQESRFMLGPKKHHLKKGRPSVLFLFLNKRCCLKRPPKRRLNKNSLFKKKSIHPCFNCFIGSNQEILCTLVKPIWNLRSSKNKGTRHRRLDQRLDLQRLGLCLGSISWGSCRIWGLKTQSGELSNVVL